MTPQHQRDPGAGGIWISFEGIEGSGKSCQIQRLGRRLGAAGREVVLTREPGGTELGRQLRSLLLRPTDRAMHPTTELLLYVADRTQNLVEVIEPALRRDAVVVSDRYLDATVAYQGYGRGLGRERVLVLHRDPPLDLRPHRTILLDLEVELALTRARGRDAGTGLDATEGRFEREALEFHRRVRAGYLEMAAAEPERYRTVDARGRPEDVEERVARALSDLLPCHERGSE
jgi:dTMP kinase